MPFQTEFFIIQQLPILPQPGEVFATLAARDADSGVLGTEGVRYTDISGPLREHLLLDPLTGRLALAHTGFR
jgi:hypothetical protein